MSIRLKVFSVNDAFMYEVSRKEAESLHESGTASLFCRRCGRHNFRGRCAGSEKHDPIVRLRIAVRGDQNSPSTITFGEMKAVVGIGSYFDVKRAQEKLAAWPHVGEALWRARA